MENMENKIKNEKDNNRNNNEEKKNKETKVEYIKDEKNERLEEASEKSINDSKFVKEIMDWIFCIIIALVIAFLIKYFLGTFTTVQQESMYPTLENNQKLWLDRTIRTFNGKYKRGDIVTFESPVHDTVYISNSNPKAVYYDTEDIFRKFTHSFLEFGKISLIKRVIAVEGDRVQIKDGKVFVNDKEIEEKYLPEGLETHSEVLNDFVVPEGYLFMMGDNRPKSTDSRVLGCIPIEKMEGRVTISVYPFNTFGKIREKRKINE